MVALIGMKSSSVRLSATYRNEGAQLSILEICSQPNDAGGIRICSISQPKVRCCNINGIVGRVQIKTRDLR